DGEVHIVGPFTDADDLERAPGRCAFEALAPGGTRAGAGGSVRILLPALLLGLAGQMPDQCGGRLRTDDARGVGVKGVAATASTAPKGEARALREQEPRRGPAAG